MPGTPHPADVHAGDPAEVIASAMTAAFDAVVQAVAALDLRPSSVEVHRQLGLTDVVVYFPSNDVHAVDALATRFGLPEADELFGGVVFYVRTGPAALGDQVASLTVRTVRPGAKLPTGAAVAVVAELAPAPLVITGELARAELPAGGAA